MLFVSVGTHSFGKPCENPHNVQRRTTFSSRHVQSA